MPPSIAEFIPGTNNGSGEGYGRKLCIVPMGCPLQTSARRKTLIGRLSHARMTGMHLTYTGCEPIGPSNRFDKIKLYELLLLNSKHSKPFEGYGTGLTVNRKELQAIMETEQTPVLPTVEGRSSAAIRWISGRKGFCCSSGPHAATGIFLGHPGPSDHPDWQNPVPRKSTRLGTGCERGANSLSDCRGTWTSPHGRTRRSSWQRSGGNPCPRRTTTT